MSPCENEIIDIRGEGKKGGEERKEERWYRDGRRMVGPREQFLSLRYKYDPRDLIIDRRKVLKSKEREREREGDEVSRSSVSWYEFFLENELEFLGKWPFVDISIICFSIPSIFHEFVFATARKFLMEITLSELRLEREGLMFRMARRSSRPATAHPLLKGISTVCNDEKGINRIMRGGRLWKGGLVMVIVSGRGNWKKNWKNCSMAVSGYNWHFCGAGKRFEQCNTPFITAYSKEMLSQHGRKK